MALDQESTHLVEGIIHNSLNSLVSNIIAIGYKRQLEFSSVKKKQVEVLQALRELVARMPPGLGPYASGGINEIAGRLVSRILDELPKGGLGGASVEDAYDVGIEYLNALHKIS